MKFSKLELIRQSIKHKGFIQKLPAIWRMIKLWRQGKYKMKATSIILPALGLLYVLSPIDLLPEIAIPFIGSLDDVAILALVIPKLMAEVDKFLLWEKMQKEGIDINEIDTIE
ncbi:MAG: DUF1232 domain-containing protein [Bergeyella zoohelcum]|nr:DUF1232 domain-containing protein [Bergeyella zoohelcum]